MIEVMKEDTFGDYELSILHDTLGVKRFVVLLTGPWGKGGRIKLYQRHYMSLPRAKTQYQKMAEIFQIGKYPGHLMQRNELVENRKGE